MISLDSDNPGAPVWRNRDTALRFRALGLETFEDFMAASGLEVVKDTVGWKKVLRGSFADGTVFYLKVLDGIPARERRAGRWRAAGDRSPAGREWRALCHLEAAGIAAPQPLAFAEAPGGFWAGVGRAFVASRALPEGPSLEDVVMAGELAGDLRRARRLARDLGGLLGRMHRSGLNHRDFYAGHLRLDAQGGLSVLDLDRAEIRAPAPVPERRRVKDLAALDFSLPRRLVDDDLRRRAFAAYLAVAPVRDRARFRAAIARKSAAIRRHAERKIARGDANIHINA